MHLNKKPYRRVRAHSFALALALTLASACHQGIHTDTSSATGTTDAAASSSAAETASAEDTGPTSAGATMTSTTSSSAGSSSAAAVTTTTTSETDGSAGAGATTGPPPVCEEPDQTLRVATWNIAGVGAPGSEPYLAARAILERLGADVVALNEIEGDQDLEHLASLMAETGYDQLVAPEQNPFGDLRNAIISRRPLTGALIHDPALLSGDPEANDVARSFVQATVDRPEPCADLTIVAAHYKSGWEPSDDFRRAVEAARMAQAGALVDGYYMLVGDFNEEVDQGPHDPDPLSALPDGLPVTYSLGADLAALLEGPGVRNEPFFYLRDPDWGHATALDAQQLDGDWSTRIGSSRRIDYLMVGPALLAALSQEDALVTEVYSSEDEPLDVGQGLEKYGEPLPLETSELASDHRVVVAELRAP